MRFIGITGGVGAGKTELLAYIRKHYLCEILLADEVAHLVKKPGTHCYEELVKLLGKEVLKADGEIHKGKMAACIFADAQLLKKVNALIYPAVRQFILERYEAAVKQGQTELFFVEAALLIEAGYAGLVDEMWYVHAENEIRRKRLAFTRGYSEEKITQIMESQLSEDAFRKACDFVIDNSGSLEESYRQIDRKLEAFSWRE